MKIDSQKDLAKLIALCRKTGVQSIKVDNIEFHLGEEPHAQPRAYKQPKMGMTLPKSGIEALTAGPDVVESDEMTEDQLLMWSVTGAPDANASDQN